MSQNDKAMGPIALFDKSFLHSLNLNEAVWFDHFFLANVCPLFYAETLADLEKEFKDDRNGSDVVRVIAEKTPQMHGAPCVHHTTLGINNLMGRSVSVDTRQIPLAGGRRVRVGGEIGTVFQEAPEAKAFRRWQEGHFEEVEREFARRWREELKTMDLREAAALLRDAGVTDFRRRNLAEARALAAEIVRGTDRLADRMRVALSLLGIRQGLWRPIQQIWTRLGRPPLGQYAPYAAHAAEVELFFQVCLASGLISTERPSNKLDIAYLHYLPFCMAFVSGDKLHRSCAPLFLKEDQEFVWAPDLKADLARANDHFELLPEATKELGIMAFAHAPPDTPGSVMVKLWDKCLPRWREVTSKTVQPSRHAPELASKLRRFERAPSLARGDPAYEDTDSDALSIQRLITRKRGSWWQVPKDLEQDSAGR